MDELNFQRRVEDDPNANEIISYFTRIPGFHLLYSHIAPHCGVLYCHFTATEDGLKEAMKITRAINVFTCVTYVKENDRVEYQISLGNSLEHTLCMLENHFDTVTYQCPGCATFWKWGQLNLDSKCPRCNFQLNKHQDEVINV